MPSKPRPVTITERVMWTLRFDAAHAARITRIAAEQKRSANAQLEHIIEAWLASHDDTGAKTDG